MSTCFPQHVKLRSSPVRPHASQRRESFEVLFLEETLIEIRSLVLHKIAVYNVRKFLSCFTWKWSTQANCPVKSAGIVQAVQERSTGLGKVRQAGLQTHVLYEQTKKGKKGKKTQTRQHGLRNKTIPNTVLTWKCPHTQSCRCYLEQQIPLQRSLSHFLIFPTLHTQLYPEVDLKNIPALPLHCSR